MFIDAGDFFIKLENFNKKIKNAQQELAGLSSNLGKAMKEPESKKLERVKEIGLKVSRAYHELGKYYAELKEEYAKVEEQMTEVNSRVENFKQELRQKEGPEILQRAVETYEGAIFVNSLFFSEIYRKMSFTLQDFADVIGQVKAIAEIIKGFSGFSEKGIEELQRSMSETDRYIW